MNKFINLLEGIELLAIGVKFHNFNTDDFNIPGNKKGVEDKDKKYILKLLFGDIFYSRAVIYLLKFSNN